MIKDHSPGSGRTLTFVSGKPWFGAAVFAGLIVALAIATFAKGDLGTVATPGNTAGTVVFLIFLHAFFYRLSLAGRSPRSTLELED